MSTPAEHAESDPIEFTGCRCAWPDLVDRAHRGYLRRGAIVEDGPRRRASGTYEMHVHDPDGSLLRVLH